MIATLVPGRARAEVLILDEPLSLWGGVDGKTGIIIEERHPQAGECVAGRIVVMSHGKGSSSASSVLAELLRIGVGPSAIVLYRADPILVIGSLVAEALYKAGCPIVVTDTPPEHPGSWEIDAGVPEARLQFCGQNAD